MTELTRREFLKGAGALAAAALLPGCKSAEKPYQTDELSSWELGNELNGTFLLPQIYMSLRSEMIGTIREAGLNRRTKANIEGTEITICYSNDQFSPPTEEQLRGVYSFILEDLPNNPGLPQSIIPIAPKGTKIFMTQTPLPSDPEKVKPFTERAVTLATEDADHYSSLVNLALDDYESLPPGTGFWTEFGQAFTNFRPPGSLLETLLLEGNKDIVKEREAWANQFGLAVASAANEMTYDDYRQQHGDDRSKEGFVPAGEITFEPYPEGLYGKLLSIMN